VVDRRGKPISNKALAATWGRVCRDLAADVVKGVVSPPVAVVRSHRQIVEPPRLQADVAPVRVLVAPAVISQPAAPPPAATPGSADHPATAPPLKPWQLTGEQKLERLNQQLRDLDPKMPTPRFTGPLK